MDGYEFWSLGIVQVHGEVFGRENPHWGVRREERIDLFHGFSITLITGWIGILNRAGLHRCIWEESLSLLDDKFSPTPLASSVVSVAKAAMDESTLVSLGAVCASR